MPIQTKSAAQIELDRWYAARADLADGKSVTISTETGTRSLTAQDMASVEQIIRRLERKVTNHGNRPHNYAVANLSKR